jgi:hypothetical protein
MSTYSNIFLFLLLLTVGLSDDDRDAVYKCIFNAMQSHYADSVDNDVVGRQTSTAHKERNGLLDSDSEGAEDDNYGVDEKIMNELNSYRYSKAEAISTDPLEFWKAKEDAYPIIAMQAKKLLCIPATSLPCERLFSAGGILIDKRRSQLRPDHVQQLLCLQSWLE